MFVMINRGDYWQCGYVIPKGGFDALRAEGLAGISRAHRRAGAVHRGRRRATAGLECGQPAHRDRRSPDRGGTGRDCCASATRPTRCRRWAASASISRYRTPSPPRTCSRCRCARRASRPTIWRASSNGASSRRGLTQRFQLAVQNRVIANVLAGTGIGSSGKLPLPLRLLARFPVLRRIPARLIGVGVRPEHVHSPLAATAPAP